MPIGGVRFWKSCIRAAGLGMQVPKTTVNENSLLLLAPDYVGLSLQLTCVESKSISELVNKGADQ